MAATILKKEDKSIELKIAIPWADVKKAWDEVVSEMVKNANLPGFRKGKAPKNLAEKNLDKEKIQQEVLRRVLPKAYIDAVTQHNLKPIIDPKIHVKPFTEGKDWEFEAITCEEPEVKLSDYKKRVAEVTAKSKIIIAGKEKEEPKLDDIIKALLDGADIALPQMIVDQETDRLLAQTLDEIKKIGMSLDQYLASTGKTGETLRAEYMEKATKDLELEFALRKIAEMEKITVDDADLEKTIEKAPTEEEKQNLRANKYFLASIIRQQKTLDFLRNL
jgi:FKBP-type peptidyl-prolyl cis-trans isomerase (trigger factor)